MKISKLVDQIYFIEDILDLQNYSDLFQTVKEEAGFNKKGRTGRRMCRMTNNGIKYTLFGKPYARKDYTETVQRIRKEIEQKLQFKEDYFNTCTLNYYDNGASGFGDHTDKMPDLERPMIVATLTLGNSNRIMTLTNIYTRRQYGIRLPHNSLLLMGPQMQDMYLHGIPKEKGLLESRLSLSFRRQKIKLNKVI
jgi:alkylated DNA repair dioxygenase AlkB